MSPTRCAVVGLGRAGRARVRDLGDHPDAELAAVVRPSSADGPDDLESVLRDRAIDAVIVCTPNRMHAPAVRAALQAGKHVAVEFPLASSAPEARELLARASAAGRVLHVEHIELLSASQARQRERAALLGRPRGGALRFQGGADGWIGDADLAGSPALRAVARLHRLFDLFGPAELRAAAVEPLPGGYRLDVELAFRAGGATRLVESRGPGLERRTEWAIECERGVLDDPAPVPERGLFRRDLDCFVERIAGRARSYVSDARVLEVLGIVDEISGP